MVVKSLVCSRCAEENGTAGGLTGGVPALLDLRCLHHQPLHWAAGEHYYVTETYTTTNSDGETVTETREVCYTRWYPVSGTVERFFDDVLIPSTTRIANKQLDRLEPWDLGKVVPYNHAYLAGFKAQRYQVPLEMGFENAKVKMAKVIESDVRCDIGGDDQQVDSVSTGYSAITFKHILLPVWLSAYRFNNKQFQIMVNAHTGQVLGDRPYSTTKIALAVAAGVLVLIGGIWAISHLKSRSSHSSPSHIPGKVIKRVLFPSSLWYSEKVKARGLTFIH